VLLCYKPKLCYAGNSLVLLLNFMLFY